VSHWLLVAVLPALLAACATAHSPEPRRPSAAEALAVLAESVRRAEANDFEALCALGTASCRTVLESVGPDNRPLDPPRVVRNAPMLGTDGLRLLVVCGRHRDGAPYVTEMAVAYGGSRVVLLQPVYWSGMSVGAAPSSLPVPEPPPATGAPSCG
jgi:hypothetical protein